MDFSEQVKATTQNYLIPKAIDNVLGSQVMAYRFIGKAKRGKGETIKRALKVTNSGQATSFAGMDSFNVSQLATKQRISYDMRATRQPIALSGMDLSANDPSDTQVTDLLTVSLEETEQELVDYFGTLFYGTGTGNSNKDVLGLGAHIDDGTDVTTIGGLSRTTYPVLNSTRTASGGTLTLALLATLHSSISSGTGKSSPTAMSSNETVWDLYETLLTPIVRESYQLMGTMKLGINGNGMSAGEGLQGTQGFTALSYRGIPWFRDEKATTQNIFMINEQWLDWYGWNAHPSTGYKPVSLGSTQIDSTYAEPGLSDFHGFNFSGLKNPPNQFSVIGDLVLLGNLMGWQPRRQGRLTGVTGV